LKLETHICFEQSKNQSDNFCCFDTRAKLPGLIKQRYKGDCAVASLAMFLGISYENILKHYSEELAEKFYDGAWNSKTLRVAKEYGVELTCIYENFNLNKPSLLVVPSLNIEGRLHTIYWDGENVFDPAIGKCYEILPKNIAYIFQKYEFS
jgi:hypothetical protein